MRVPFVRNAYNYDMNKAGDESGLRCEDVSLAKQSFAEEVDINTIVKRFHLTGELPDGISVPDYGDFSDVTDFHSAMNVVAKAKEGFETLPAVLRSKFHNDPAEFMEFVSDDKNREEAEKIGLVLKKSGDENAERLESDRNKFVEVLRGLRDSDVAKAGEKGQQVASDKGSDGKAVQGT